MVYQEGARRGFSLIELMVVVGTVAMALSLSVPLLTRMAWHNRLGTSARMVVAHLTRARGLAASGTQVGASPPWTAQDRTRSAGIQITSETQYLVFIDRDTLPGDEIVMMAVDLEVEYPGQQIRIETPAPGAEIRFRPNGTIISPQNITVADLAANTRRTISVMSGGRARIQ